MEYTTFDSSLTILEEISCPRKSENEEELNENTRNLIMEFLLTFSMRIQYSGIWSYLFSI